MTEDNVEIKMYFSKDYIEYMKEKFCIEDEDDIVSAVWECIETYMEL